MALRNILELSHLGIDFPETVKLFKKANAAEGPGTSQHLTDWYTFSHLLHCFWLYFLLWLVFSHLAISGRLVLAVLLEAGWEVLENTPFIIQRYRVDTISASYYGDTIVNSISDTLTAVAGFLFAAWAPAMATILL